MIRRELLVLFSFRIGLIHDVCVRVCRTMNWFVSVFLLEKITWQISSSHHILYYSTLSYPISCHHMSSHLVTLLLSLNIFFQPSLPLFTAITSASKTVFRISIDIRISSICRFESIINNRKSYRIFVSYRIKSNLINILQIKSNQLNSIWFNSVQFDLNQWSPLKLDQFPPIVCPAGPPLPGEALSDWFLHLRSEHFVWHDMTWQQDKTGKVFGFR